MKKSRKSRVAASYSEIHSAYVDSVNAGRANAVEITAEAFGVSESTVYRVIRQFADSAKIKPSPAKGPEPIVSLAVRLPSDGTPIVVQIRNGSSALMGTVSLESAGIRYRRPNAKTPADRILSWDTLDKLMQIGLV